MSAKKRKERREARSDPYDDIDIFSGPAGQVWCTDDRFAEEVVEECAAFPYGDHDDLVDSTTQALLRFRQGNFIQLESDYADEPKYIEQREYYG